MEEFSFGIFDHIERTSGSSNLTELYQERLRLLEAYDRAGLWCYHLAQHHATPLGMAPSPNVFLAAAAQATRQIRLGPLVYLLPFYSPLRLIEEICMLDHLSGGRLEIGVGRGVSPFELAHHRIPFYESRDIYEEGLEVLLKGLRNDRLSHRGHYYHYEDVPMELRPKQNPHPAFWYGVIDERSTAYAARRGMQLAAIGSLDRLKRLASVYREYYPQSLDHPDNVNPHIRTPKIGAQRHIVVAGSDRDAEQIARDSYAVFYRNIQKLWRDFNTTVGAFPAEYEVFRNAGVAIVGSVSSVRDQVARFFEQSGCNYLILSFAWGSLSADQARRSFDLFASNVMPDFCGPGEREPKTARAI